MSKHLLYSVILLLFAVAATAQPLGNEWINPSQQYFKITVAEDGVYQVTQQSLAAAGAPVGSIDPQHLQVFYRGQEVPVFVAGEQDGSFDAGDYIEFFGQRNDGALDTALYQKVSQQPNPFYSLFTDTSAYFITWSNSLGQRVQVANDTSFSGKTPIPYYMRTQRQHFLEAYHDGPPPQDYLLDSRYTLGEGWTSSLVSSGRNLSASFNTKDRYKSGPNAQFRTVAFSKSNPETQDPNGYNHHMQLEMRGSSGWQMLDEEWLIGYDRADLTGQVPASSLSGNITTLRFKTLNDLSAHSDHNVVSYMELEYPALFDLQGESTRQFELDAQGTTQYVKWNGYASGMSHPVVYDIAAGRKIRATLANGQVHLLIPAASEHELFLTDSTQVKQLQPRPVQFIDFQQAVPSGMDFLIYSSKKIKGAATRYANYRNSSGFTTYTAYSEDLYNQFYYGQHHPLAIRNFASYLIQQGKKPGYTLLLGKGISTDAIRVAGKEALDLVPTMGVPPSDNLLFAGLGTTRLEPPFALGRIAAMNEQQADTYLEKLKSYESLGPEAWRKNVFHISGGRNVQENTQFKNYLQAYQHQWEGPLMGADVQTISKDDALPTSQAWKEYIIEEFNEGIGMSVYFGHGAADVLELDIGLPEEWGNEDKYSVMYFTGCILGHCYSDAPSKGEKFLFEPDKGAIMWIAGSSYGFTGILHQFSNRFAEYATDTLYGASVAEQLRATIEDFQRPNDIYVVQQSLQTVIQGDPAVAIYSPSKPDYTVASQDLHLYPQGVTAEADSFAVVIPAQNIGKAVRDTIGITLTRTFADNSTITYDTLFTIAPLSTDTLRFWIHGKKSKGKGTNRFTVVLDAGDRIPELDEANNEATLEHFMPSNGASPLMPQQYSIVPDRNVELMAQSNNVLLEEGTYFFEIDTTPDFSSSWKQASGAFKAAALARWPVQLLAQDTQAYYWRVRLRGSDGSLNEWEEGTFTYINGSPQGWAQVDFPQFSGVESDFAELDTVNEELRFTRETSVIYYISTAGGRIPGSMSRYHRTIRKDYNKVTYDNLRDGMAFFAVDPDNLKHYSYSSPYNTTGNTPINPEPKTGIFYFDWVVNDSTINTAVLDSFFHYWRNMPENYHVFAYSGVRHLLDLMPDSFYTALEDAGAVKVRNIPAGHPYILVGQRGLSKGKAQETTADLVNVTTPPDSQIISASTVLYPLRTHATVQSVNVGPALSWQNFQWEAEHLEMPTADSLSFHLLGIKASGEEDTLFAHISDSVTDLTGVDASLYPNLRIEAYVQDEVERTPPQIRKWIVLYEGPPEGTVDAETAFSFYADTLQQGDTVSIEVAFRNISPQPMDSLLVRYEVVSDSRQVVYKQEERLQPLNPDEALIASHRIATLGLDGDYELRVQFNPEKDQPEQVLFNNFVSTNFHVITDEVNPVLDVTFDGAHIQNGAIVSPSPRIRITSKDENPFLIQDDTTLMEVYLLQPGQAQEERIWFSRDDVEFLPGQQKDNQAEVIFHPQNLQDGTYQFRVVASDASGNASGEHAYSVQFQVVTESGISEFYPIPNPVTNQMRFAFTLTGPDLPDEITVQIASLNGRVVRELRMSDFGEIRVGYNETNWLWDGRDQNGDLLSNGIYIYKVYPEKDGEIMEATPIGDRYQGGRTVGKIVLLR